MQTQDEQRFVELMIGLSGNFGKEASKPWLDGQWLALSDLSIEDLTRAVMRALRECQYMPVASELRRLSGELPTDQRAIKAWDAVHKAIGQHGAYASVDFDDPVINAALRNLGGWVKLCSATEDEAKWIRKDFERVYAALRSSGISEEAAKALPGLTEQANSANGYALAPPVVVTTGLPPHGGEVVLRHLGGGGVVQGLLKKSNEETPYDYFQ